MSSAGARVSLCRCARRQAFRFAARRAAGTPLPMTSPRAKTTRSPPRGSEVVVVAPDLAHRDVLAGHVEPGVGEGWGQQAPLDLRGQAQLLGHAAGQRLDPGVEAFELGVLPLQLDERPPGPQHRAQAQLQLRVLHQVADDLVDLVEERGRRGHVRRARHEDGGTAGAGARPQSSDGLAERGFGQAGVQDQEVGRAGPRVEDVGQAPALDPGLGKDGAPDTRGYAVPHQDGAGPGSHVGALEVRHRGGRGLARPRSGGLHDGSTNL